MALTEAKVVALELEKVRKKVPTLFEREDMFFSMIEKKNVEKISNRDMRVPLEIRPGGKSRHYNPDGGDLGRGDAPEFDKAVVNTVHLSHAVEINHKADIATNDGRKAVLSAFRKSLATGIAEFRRVNNALAMTGGDGVLATITSVDTSSSKDTYTCTTDGYGVKLVRHGHDVGIYNAGLTTKRAGGDHTIDLVDLENKQFRVDVNVASSAATDKVVFGGLTATPPVSLLGVPYHHDNASTGTWLGFNRANFPEVRANRVTASAAFALPFARQAINKIGDRLGESARKKKLKACMHPAQKQAYEDLGQLVSIIQKQAKSEGLDLYFDTMQMAGASVYDTYFWDRTRIDFVNLDIWGRGVMEEISFYGDKHGRKLFEARSTDGGVAASWLYYLVTSYNFFVDNPPAISYISDLDVPSGY
jgi:hypothetical protein